MRVWCEVLSCAAQKIASPQRSLELSPYLEDCIAAGAIEYLE